MVESLLLEGILIGEVGSSPDAGNMRERQDRTCWPAPPNGEALLALRTVPPPQQSVAGSVSNVGCADSRQLAASGNLHVAQQSRCSLPVQPRLLPSFCFCFSLNVWRCRCFEFLSFQLCYNDKPQFSVRYMGVVYILRKFSFFCFVFL